MQFCGMRSFVAIAVITLAIPAQAKQCMPSGLFFRSHGDQLKVDPVELKASLITASFRLVVLGNVVQDAPTIGRAEGEISFTQDLCVGVYNEGSACTLVFNFSPKSAKIQQIGECSFGAGAKADGTFLKTTKPERYLP